MVNLYTYKILKKPNYNNTKKSYKKILKFKKKTKKPKKKN